MVRNRAGEWPASHCWPQAALSAPPPRPHQPQPSRPSAPASWLLILLSLPSSLTCPWERGAQRRMQWPRYGRGHLAWGAGVGPGQGRGAPRGRLSSAKGPTSACERLRLGCRRLCPSCPAQGLFPMPFPAPARILVLRSAVLLAFTGVFIRDSHQIRFPSSTCRCFKCPHFTENGETDPKKGFFLRLKSRARSRGPRPLRLHTQLLEHHLVCPRCTPGPVGGGSGVRSVRAAPRGLL